MKRPHGSTHSRTPRLLLYVVAGAQGASSAHFICSQHMLLGALGALSKEHFRVVSCDDCF